MPWLETSRDGEAEQGHAKVPRLNVEGKVEGGCTAEHHAANIQPARPAVDDQMAPAQARPQLNGP